MRGSSIPDWIIVKLFASWIDKVCLWIWAIVFILSATVISDHARQMPASRLTCAAARAKSNWRRERRVGEWRELTRFALPLSAAAYESLPFCTSPPGEIFIELDSGEVWRGKGQRHVQILKQDGRTCKTSSKAKFHCVHGPRFSAAEMEHMWEGLHFGTIKLKSWLFENGISWVMWQYLSVIWVLPVMHSKVSSAHARTPGNWLYISD